MLCGSLANEKILQECLEFGRQTGLRGVPQVTVPAGGCEPLGKSVHPVQGTDGNRRAAAQASCWEEVI